MLLTNQSDTAENLAAGFTAGMDDFLTKPVARPELKRQLELAQLLIAPHPAA